MTGISEEIEKHASEADAGWGAAYGLFGKVLERNRSKTGAEIGVAFGGHAESILKIPTIDRLYGVDPYEHINSYEDPMNLPQEQFNQLYYFTVDRLAKFDDRYRHIRKRSKDAARDIQQIDFVYIDADHSYRGVWEDLCTWYPKVREGGIIGGHDYDHPDFQGTTEAVNEFFRRFGWKVNIEGEGVWWAKKEPLHVSFFIPAYNCEKTIRESVESIMENNFMDGDEIVIVNDSSTDGTGNILYGLEKQYSSITIIRHKRNKGGAAARNTAIENTKNQILFCLDSDNVLVPGTIQKLKRFLENSGADVASFQELHYFKTIKSIITHKWTFKEGITTLSDYLSGNIVPGASGNYMFTKESWIRSGGYPEFSGALDAWGFGFRQLATGSKMVVMPNSHYFHRYGHESYWVRESKKGNTSLIAIQILIPFLDLINDRDVDKILSRSGRYSWFDNLENRPIRLKSGDVGSTGVTTSKNLSMVQRFLSKMKRTF